MSITTTRQELNKRNFETLISVKALIKEARVKTEFWECEMCLAECDVRKYEALIEYYDTPDIVKGLTKAYNRLRHCQYLYDKCNYHVIELEQVYNALESADYWL